MTTFGDLMRVPGTDSSLQASGLRAGYPRGLLGNGCPGIARQHPDKRVVFLGVGFETTAPTIAATIMTANTRG